MSNPLDTTAFGQSEHDGLSLEEWVFWIEHELGIAIAPERMAELDRQIAIEDAAEIAIKDVRNEG